MSGMGDKVEARKHLIEGLVGEHVDLWRNSAWFHAAVTTLADMLPMMVNGFAAEAETKQTDQQELLAKIMRGAI